MTIFETLKHFIFGSATPIAHADRGGSCGQKKSQVAEDAGNSDAQQHKPKNKSREHESEHKVHSEPQAPVHAAAEKIQARPHVRSSHHHKQNSDETTKNGTEVHESSKTLSAENNLPGEPKHGKHHEHTYRECGEVKMEVMDTVIPDIDQSELEPILSIVPECFNLKVEYDECFNRWFAQDFLNGKTNMKPCMELFKKYSACVKNGLGNQDFELYPALALVPPDPDVNKAKKPRSKPPPGAQVHRDDDHHQHDRRHK